MSALEAARAAIVAKLAAVEGVGRVHDHEPYAADQARLKALYLADGEAALCGWFVRRVATRELGTAIGRSIEVVTWQIRGYRALSEEAGSEINFDALIEAIRDAFRNDDTLGGAVGSTVTDEHAGIQVDESGPVLFAGVLCHAATLRLTTMTAL